MDSSSTSKSPATLITVAGHTKKPHKNANREVGGKKSFRKLLSRVSFDGVMGVVRCHFAGVSSRGRTGG